MSRNLHGAAARALPGRPAELPATIAVYREMLLNYNESFLRNQGESFRRYRAVYVADHRVAKGLDLPPERTIVLRDRFRNADRRIDRIVSALPPALRRSSLAQGETAARAASYVFRRLGWSPYLIERLRAAGTTLVHAHTGLSAAQALPLATRLGVPLVATYHGYETNVADDQIRMSLRRGPVFIARRERMKREVALFIACSDFLLARMIAQGYPPERSVRLYTGIDVEFYRQDPSDVREKFVLFAGRLIESKGVSTLLRAMQGVARALPGVQLRIAGDGHLRENCEQEARALRVDATFLGVVAPVEMRRLMNRAAVLAVPSVPVSSGVTESLGGVAVEALAMGLPVVASRIGGLPEVIVDGETGELAEPGDPEDLARGLVRLLADPALAARMGAAGRERAVREFDIKRQTSRLETLYDGVRENRARG